MTTRLFAMTAVIATVLPFASPSRAVGDTITLQFTGGTIHQSVSYSGSYGDISGDVGGGPFTWTVTAGPSNFAVGSTLQTWCADLFQHITTDGPTTYSLTDITSLPNATTVQNLFGEAFKNGGVVADAAAFQLALWELQYDTTPGSLSAGNFLYSGGDSTVLANADSLLNQALYDTAHGVDAFGNYLKGYSLDVLASPSDQDQVVLLPPAPSNTAVPAPPAALLAAFGVVVLGGRRRWIKWSKVNPNRA